MAVPAAKGKKGKSAVEKVTSPLANIGKTALTAIGQTSQGSLHALQKANANGQEFGAVGGLAPQHFLRAIGAGLKATADTDPEHRINFRQATGGPAQGGGFAGDVLDVIGASATDPLTYAGVGGLARLSSAGKVGIKAVTSALDKKAADTILAKGFEALPAAQQPVARAAIREAGKGEGDKGLSALYRAATGRAARTGSQKFEEKLIGKEGASAQVGQLLGGQGLKVLGQTVLKRDTLARGANTLGAGKVAEIAGKSAVGKDIARAGAVIKAAVVPRAGILASGSGRLGEEAVQDLQAGNRGQTGISNATTRAALQEKLGSIAKSANVTATDMEDITHALELGSISKLATTLENSGRHQEAAFARALEQQYQRVQGIAKNAEPGRATTLAERNRTGAEVTARAAEDVRGPDVLRSAGFDPAAPGTGRITNTQGPVIGTNAAEEFAVRGQGDLFGLGGPVASGGNAGADAAAAALRGSNRAGSRVAPVLGRDAAESFTVGGQGNLLDDAGVHVAQRLTKIPTRALHLLAKENPAALDEALGLGPGGGARFVENAAEEIEKIRPGRTIREVNEELSQKLGESLKGAKAFETDPVRAVLTYGDRVQRDVAFAGGLDNLAKLVGDDGLPLAIRAGGEKIPPGYAKVGTRGVLGDYYAPAAIAKELEGTYKALSEDETLAAFGKAVQSVNTFWKTQATSSLLFGTGYQVRNVFGNLFNMALKGFDDPKLLVTEAPKYQKVLAGIGKDGKDYKTVIAESSLTPAQKTNLQNMIESDVIGGGFFKNDVKGGGIKVTQQSRAADIVNPLSANSAPVRGGRAIANALEENSRIAMYLSDLSKHGDPAQAARTVRETLFDYADLTATEKALKNNLIPFYTWQRKNFALQMWALAHSPGKIAIYDRMKQDIAANGPDLEGKQIPGYAEDGGQVGLFSYKGTPILGTIQSPTEAAFKFAQPLADLTSLLTPGDLHQDNGAQRAASGLVGQFGGITGGAAVKGLVEEATGVSSFSGAPLEQSEGALGKRLLRLTSPSAGKTDSAITKLKGSPTDRLSFLLSQAGLTNTALTPEAERSAILRTRSEGAKVTAAARKRAREKAKKAQS